jgi:hypothetical protein
MVKAALASFKPSDMAFLITQTLVVGMRACADLADNARAHRDEPAVSAALSAAGDLASWADGQAVPPLADHPFLAQTRGRGTAHRRRSSRRSRTSPQPDPRTRPARPDFLAHPPAPCPAPSRYLTSARLTG